MRFNFYPIIQYIQYFFSSKNEHAIQAPFLFNFYLNLIKKKPHSADFQAIEQMRNALLENSGSVKNINFGAESKVNSPKKTIKNITATSLSSPKKSQLLYAIIQYLQSKTILEIGTSVGISTAYFASANKEALVYTLEGNPDLVNEARRVSEILHLKNINFIEGNFDDTLPALLADISNKIDFVFLDGNHLYEPTLRYFQWILPHLHENSILIVDDIYWSAEMTKAWRSICVQSDVTISVDLFEIGIVFFSKKYSKQHFILKF